VTPFPGDAFEVLINGDLPPVRPHERAAPRHDPAGGKGRRRQGDGHLPMPGKVRQAPGVEGEEVKVDQGVIVVRGDEDGERAEVGDRGKVKEIFVAEGEV